MNKVIFMGRLTRDPETRYTPGEKSTCVCTFSIAINRRFARQGEERQADFFNIVTYGKTGEFCSKYFKKGQQVGLIGRMQNNNWTDQNNVKHYSNEMVAEEAYFADSKKDGYGDVPAAPFDTSFNNEPNPMPETPTTGADGASDFEVSSGDDLPF